MKKILLLSALLATAWAGYAQRFVTGTITSKDEGVLPGVNILLKGSRTGVAADGTGSYKISVPRRQRCAGV